MNLVITGDGSHTLHVPELNEHYHSTFGAIKESRHVFIHAGLKCFEGKGKIVLFEAGFGTGLNALLTCMESVKLNLKIEYYALEKYPLDPELVLKLNYPQLIGEQSAELFRIIHSSPWERKIQINEAFDLFKIRADLTGYEHINFYDLVYFDAFAPEKQPDLWTEDIFRRLSDAMNACGILVTYSVKGDVKRALKNAGFRIEKLPGPEGKREILRGTKFCIASGC